MELISILLGVGLAFPWMWWCIRKGDQIGREIGFYKSLCKDKTKC